MCTAMLRTGIVTIGAVLECEARIVISGQISSCDATGN